MNFTVYLLNRHMCWVVITDAYSSTSSYKSCYLKSCLAECFIDQMASTIVNLDAIDSDSQKNFIAFKAITIVVVTYKHRIDAGNSEATNLDCSPFFA